MSPFPELPLFGGYLPTSFLDWEGRVTAVIFLKGCNFRCPFCHNAPLVTGMAEGLETGPVLADILRASDRKVTIEEIQRKVAEHYNVRLSDLIGPKRMRTIARP